MTQPRKNNFEALLERANLKKTVVGQKCGYFPT
jgi:hypothetical protein